MIETKKIGLNRELEALKNIEHFGFLTTKSIADLTVGVEGDTASKSAKRVLKRLIEKREILKRESLDGIGCFVLTKVGAQRIAPFCYGKKAKNGIELATRFARRQELIVSTLCKIRKSIEPETILLGEVWLKRDKKKRFKGLHGVVWNFETKKAITVFVASSCRDEIAEHIVNLHYRHKDFISQIIIVAIDRSTAEIVRNKTRAKWNEVEKELLRKKPIEL